MFSESKKYVSVLPKVSHVIISYNQRNYIDDAIRTAVEQDYTNLEVVVSDDGSTDGTAELIAEWKAKYPDRIIAVLNKTNSGITENCNHALSACTGDFVSFQGGDDILLQGKISAQVDWFANGQNRVLCGHQMEVFYDDGVTKPHIGKLGFKPGSGPVELIKNGVPFGATSIMVRASEIPEHGFDDSIKSASDLIFYIETLMNGGEYGAVDGVYARYRIHSNNITKNKENMLVDVGKTYKSLAQRYPKYRRLCNRMYVEHYLYYSGVICLTGLQKKEAKEFFIATLKRRPFFLRAWVRLLQCI